MFSAQRSSLVINFRPFWFLAVPGVGQEGEGTSLFGGPFPPPVGPGREDVGVLPGTLEKCTLPLQFGVSLSPQPLSLPSLCLSHSSDPIQMPESGPCTLSHPFRLPVLLRL